MIEWPNELLNESEGNKEVIDTTTKRQISREKVNECFIKEWMNQWINGWLNERSSKLIND